MKHHHASHDSAVRTIKAAHYLNSDNILEAIHYLLELDINSIAPLYRQDAYGWIRNLKSAWERYQYLLKSDQVNVLSDKRYRLEAHRYLPTLVHRAQELTCILEPSIQAELIEYLAIALR